MPGAVELNNYVKVKSFTPSSYDADITIVAGTASTGALASGVLRGEGVVYIVNRGAGDIRIAFGTSAADATTNLTISGGIATTGYYLEDVAAWGQAAQVVFGIPVEATHYAVCNATATETPTVSVTQGV
jgi:hypothetical protein